MTQTLAIPSRNPTDRLAQSFVQQACSRSLISGVTFPHCMAVLRLEGAWDEVIIHEAIGRLLDRHEILRTVFPLRDGACEPLVEQNMFGKLSIRELVADSECDLWKSCLTFAEQPFNLEHYPPVRIGRMVAGSKTTMVVLVLHPMITDALSQRILVRDLSILLATLADGRKSNLSPLPVQYADYAVWERRILLQPEALVTINRTGERLKTLRSLTLPTDAVDASVGYAVRAGSARVELPSCSMAMVLDRAAREQVTPFVITFASFVLLVSRWAEQTVVTVASPLVIRPVPQVLEVVGPFTDSTILSVSLADVVTFRELLWTVRAAVFSQRDVANAGLSVVSSVVPEIGPCMPRISFSSHVAVPAPAPKAQPTRSIVNPERHLSLLAVDRKIECQGSERMRREYDLSVLIQPEGGTLVISADYDATLFTHVNISARLEEMAAILMSGLERPANDIAVGTSSG